MAGLTATVVGRGGSGGGAMAMSPSPHPLVRATAASRAHSRINGRQRSMDPSMRSSTRGKAAQRGLSTAHIRRPRSGGSAPSSSPRLRADCRRSGSAATRCSGRWPWRSCSDWCPPPSSPSASSPPCIASCSECRCGLRGGRPGSTISSPSSGDSRIGFVGLLKLAGGLPGQFEECGDQLVVGRNLTSVDSVDERVQNARLTTLQVVE